MYVTPTYDNFLEILNNEFIYCIILCCKIILFFIDIANIYNNIIYINYDSIENNIKQYDTHNLYEYAIVRAYYILNFNDFMNLYDVKNYFNNECIM